MGATSFVNNIRFTRPKTLKSYERFVSKLEESRINDSKIDTISLGAELSDESAIDTRL